MNIELRISNSGARRSCRIGLTLVELLLVVTIIGIASAVALPRFSVAMSGGQLSVATRTLARSARYARTMAVLYQTDTELTISSREGDPPETTVRIEMVRGTDLAHAEPAEPGHADPVHPEMAVMRDDAPGLERFDSPGALADEIRMEHRLSGITVTFLGFGDLSASDFGANSGQDFNDASGAVRVRYRSNGICRPYSFRITGGGGVWREIRVDRAGGVTIMDPNA